jgi:predicted dehydrogenase
MTMVSRRHFIKGLSTTLALSAFSSQAFSFFETQKNLRVGLIGTGWYGKSDLFKLIQIAPVEVVGLCDVDKRLLTEAGQLVSQRQKSGKVPELFNDYTKLLSAQKPDIVLIGSPDHWHALQAIDAMKGGAHVYVQKPISVDVMEGEAMVAAAAKV